MGKNFEFAIGFADISDTKNIENQLKEVSFNYIWGFIGSLGLFKEKQLEKYKKFLKDHNLEIEQIHSLFGSEYDLTHTVNSKRSIFIEGIKSEIEKLKYLGVKNYVIHCSGIVEDNERKEKIKIFIDSMERILPVAERVKMKIAIENISSRQKVIGTAEEIKRILGTFKSEFLGVCFDTGHANLSKNPKKEFNILHNNLFTFHIHDNDGERDLHLPPPYGVFDWKWFIKELKKIKKKWILPFEFVIPEKQGLKKILKNCNLLFNKEEAELKFEGRIIKVL